MASIIVVFESRYGHSQKIASYIVDRAQREGHVARALQARVATHAALEKAGAFVVVAPIYYGQHPLEIRRFLRTYNMLLTLRPFAFVSVSCSAAHSDTKVAAEANDIAHRTVEEVGLRPRALVNAGGALAYPRYRFFVRHLMRFIAKKTGAPTDTRLVHELTDWPALDRDLAPFFAAHELQRVERRVEETAPVSGVPASTPHAARSW